jgi:FkbM family methyltransferase
VGAGDGADSILFSRLAGPEGRVLAIEAQPDTVRLLRATCRLNRLSNVTIVHSAVTDSIGRIGITDLGNSLANHGVPESQNPGCSIIDTTTIDGLCDKYSILTVDYLKMNIEGAELHAIKGMQTSIGKVHRACIACHDFLNTDGGGRIKETVTDFMEFHGFKVHRRVNDERPWVRDHLYCDRTPQESVAS